MSDTPPPTFARRAVLGSTAGLALSSIAGASAAGAAPTASATPTVLTWNVSLGVDLFRLLRAESAEEARRVAGRMLEQIDPGGYEARADAIAAGIAAAGADVVALQEAARIRLRRPGDADSEPPGRASEVLVDSLSLVASKLADRALDYEVAAATTTTDVELPVETDGGRVDVRLADRDVLLVRADLETGETATDTYETSLPIPVPEADRTLVLERGYCSADVTVDGVAFTAVSTHLESVSPLIRREQARELLEALPADRPVVVGGDFNSGPGAGTEAETGTYDRLTAELDDPFVVLDPGGEGFTCCRAGDLRDERSRFDRRIDALLYRGSVRPTAVGRVGHRREDRVEVAAGGETVRLWPSDHAGVVGTFEIAASSRPTGTRTATVADGPTATPTRTDGPNTTPPPAGTQTGTPTPGRTPAASPTEEPPASASDGAGPGMGVLAAVAGVLTAVVVRSRRDRAG